MKAMRYYCRLLAIQLTVVLAFFLVLEGTARLISYWIQPPSWDFGLGFTGQSPLFIPDPKHPGYMMTNPVRISSFHEQQFSIEKPKDTVRIFFVGGSSIMFLQDQGYEPLRNRLELLFESGSDSFQPFFDGPGIHVLAEKLQTAFPAKHFEIIDAGGASYGSHRLTPIVAEVMQYSPDLVIYHEANNEFEELKQLKLTSSHAIWLQKYLSHSVICSYLHGAYGKLVGHFMARRYHQQIEDILNPRTMQSVECKDNTSRELIDTRMAQFRKNIETMASLCLVNHVTFVLGTVPSNLLKPSLICQDYKEVTDLYGKGRFEEARKAAQQILTSGVRSQATNVENAIIREVAHERQIPLAEVEQAVVAAEPHHFPGETLFIDDCHLNAKGKGILVDTYANTLISTFKTMPGFTN